MRFLVKATIPVEAGNAMVRNPNWGKTIQDIMGDIKPKNVYFCIDDGQRTILLDVDVDDASRLPSIAEPLWLAFKANVKFIPCMGQEDMAKAMVGIEAAVKKYR